MILRRARARIAFPTGYLFKWRFGNLAKWKSHPSGVVLHEHDDGKRFAAVTSVKYSFCI